MTLAVAWPPKAIDPNRFEVGSKIRAEDWYLVAESYNYALGTVGMGSVIEQAWETGTVSWLQAGVVLINDWFVPKPLKNPLKIQVYIKMGFVEEIIAIPGFTPTMEFETYTREAWEAEDPAYDNVLIPVTEIDAPGDEVWRSVGVLEVPEGDDFVFRVFLNSRDDRTTYLSQISVSFVPLIEDDEGDKFLAFEACPSGEGFGGLSNTLQTGDTALTAIAFPLNTDRMAADKPLSSWQQQALYTGLNHLLKRPIPLICWDGLDGETYSDPYGSLPASYHVSVRPSYLPKDYGAPGDINGNPTVDILNDNYIRYSTEDMEIDDVFHVYNPTTTYLYGAPVRYIINGAQYTYIPIPGNGSGEVHAFGTTPSADETPWVGVVENGIPRVGDELQEQGFPMGRPDTYLRFVYLRKHGNEVRDGDLESEGAALYLMPKGLITGWYSIGV